jgi:hypothetical protein
MITKKNYIAFARIIKSAYDTGSCDPNTVTYIRERMAGVFANDNPKFDIVRFRNACTGN